MIEPCPASDPGLRKALGDEGLPFEDLADATARFFVISEPNGARAYGGIEGEGRDRLLRSLVVTEASRGTGIGSRMAAALAEEARREGVERLWLLTTGAAGFFAGRGWHAIARPAAPAMIAALPQFASICPASATLMVRDLRA